MTDAMRFNAGKPELSYTDLFPAAVEGVARTLMYGTQRKRDPYPKWNWMNGTRYLELYDSARRHMVDWLNGEDYDLDALTDGYDLHCLDLAIGNLMRLRQQIADGTGTDDRPCEIRTETEGPVPVPCKGHEFAMSTTPLLDVCIHCHASIERLANGHYKREDGSTHSTWYEANRAKL